MKTLKELKEIAEALNADFINTGGGVYIVVKRFANSDMILVISEDDVGIYKDFDSWNDCDLPLYNL